MVPITNGRTLSHQASLSFKIPNPITLQRNCLEKLHMETRQAAELKRIASSYLVQAEADSKIYLEQDELLLG